MVVHISTEAPHQVIASTASEGQPQPISIKQRKAVSQEILPWSTMVCPRWLSTFRDTMKYSLACWTQTKSSCPLMKTPTFSVCFQYSLSIPESENFYLPAQARLGRDRIRMGLAGFQSKPHLLTQISFL